MTKRGASILLLVLLLLVVGIGLSVAFFGDDAPPPKPAPAAAPETTTAPRDAPRRAVERTVIVPEKPPDIGPSKHGPEPETPTGTGGPPKPRIVKILVLAPDGVPAEGAEVEVWTDLGTLGPDSWDAARRAAGTTDAEGRVTLPFTGFAGYAEARFRDQTGVAELDLQGDAETTVELRRATTVRGRVVDPADTPIPGAVVRLSWWLEDDNGLSDPDDHYTLLARAGDDGSFEFRATFLPGDEHVGSQIEVWARGFTRAAMPVGRDEIVVRMLPAAVVRGRCIDERNRPVAGVAVSLRESNVPPAKTDADGRFSLDGVPRTGAELRFLSDAHVPTLLRDLAVVGPEHDVGDVLLRAGGKVTGLFVHLDGKPVVGGNVWITDVATQWTYRSMVVGEDGRYVFEHVPPGPQSLVGEEPEAEGHSWTATGQARLDDVRADGGETKLVLTGALFLHVRFLDATDWTPVVVESVDVQATPLRDGSEAGGGWGWSGGTIDSVRFELGEAGAYRVEIEVPGYEKAVVEKVEALPDREARIDVLFRKR